MILQTARKKKVNAGDFTGAATQFLVWVYAGGVVEPGLLRRRQAEAAMFTGADVS